MKHKCQTESMKRFIYTKSGLFVFFFDIDLFSVPFYALLPLDNNMQTLHLCKFLLNLALCVLRRTESVK